MAAADELGGSVAPSERGDSRDRGSEEAAVIYLVGMLLVSTAVLLVLFLDYRKKLYLETGRGRGYPIPTLPLAQLDPLFAQGRLGPRLDAEVHFIGRGAGVPGGTTDTEAWVLAVLAKDARRLFEFGTASGKTSYLWARNSPPDARITTITLGPEEVSQYRREPGDRASATGQAIHESRFTDFLYSGTEVEHKIEQLFGDSKALDVEPLRGQYDVVFVDGSHARSYVRSDSAKALALVRPGGVVLWHDYRGPRGPNADVYRVLNDLHRRLPLVHLAGTNMVAWRAEGAVRAAIDWLEGS